MRTQKKQQGVVLLISLMLLLMLTIIAITAASQSNLQLRISSNSEQRNAAFQAAESGLQRWINAYFSGPDNTNFPPPIEIPEELGDTERFKVEVISAGPCPGISLRISANCFDIRSTGETCNSDNECTSRAIHRQGGQWRQFSLNN
ncbi:MAG: hypothetical protein KJ884_10120 [Gammaproteobacteria bacterium]|nr:hypothetical protein [Gammaproteobacteria bacterium]MBU1489076.1 hypothetical protein [Gammaproteobacteria bacterium]MBU2066104.1 hypothetical protein [Gammaproteobacteria bacterium]MBU2139936.1 hypothetical protein [Gammaproteobacteria bacterium]MBU2218789.1 hypothetical protein [Gammaproteobacteria bacterium]